VPCVRSRIGRSELSVLGRALFRRSDLDRLVSDPPSLSLRKSKGISSREHFAILGSRS
jgi:hypothetical protein